MNYIKFTLSLFLLALVPSNSLAKNSSGYPYNLPSEVLNYGNNQPKRTGVVMQYTNPPTANIKFDYPVPIYEFTSNVATVCENPNAMGCTKWSNICSYSINCLGNKIYIKCFNPTNYPKIFISDEFEMGSKDFDLTIKHEMTHVQLYRKSYKKLIPKLAAFAIKEYDDLLKDNKSCYDITNRIYTMFAKYMKEVDRLATEQQKLIDGPVQYLYQNMQIKPNSNMQ